MATSLTNLLDISDAGAGQVKFPSTQNASSNANTLDDYEEGTWTPVIGGSGGTSGQTYARQEGYYVKIGRLVIAQCLVQLTAKGTITNDVQIQGLPFTVQSSEDIWPCAVNWQDLATSWVNIIATPRNSETYAALTGCTAAATTNGTALTTSAIGNGTAFRVTLIYGATA